MREYPRVIYPRRRIVNEVPIEVPDSPQVEINACIRRKVTRTSNLEVLIKIKVDSTAWA